MAEHRVSLRVDTRKAKASLREFDRTRDSAIQRASQRTRTAVATRARTVLGALGGYSMVSRISRASTLEVDPWAEALTPTQAAIAQFVDETLGYNATARKQARNAVKAGYARSFAETGNKSAVQEAYAITYGMRGAEAAGTKILRQDPQFTGPSLVDLIKEAVPGYFRLIGKSVDYVVEAFLR